VYKFQASSQLKQLSLPQRSKRFQEYLIVPKAPVVPAVTEPVLVPKQVASDLVEAAKAKAVAGCLQ
jgi:hypothetical protein